MTVRAPQALPSISPAEMDFLISRTGLTLNSGQRADLVLAWRQVSALAATIPRQTVPADDFAIAFHLPPPTAKPSSRPAGKIAAGKTKAPGPKAERAKSGNSKR